MNKYFRLILWNMFFLIIVFCCFMKPDYIWVLKIISYIMLPIAIFGTMFFIIMTENIPKEYKENSKDKFYLIIDYFFDLLFMFIFAYMELQLIFVFYFISVLFTISLRYKLNENNDVENS